MIYSLGLAHRAVLDSLFKPALDQPVNIDSRGVYVIRVQCARRHDLLDLKHRDASGRRNGRIEVAGGVAVDHVSKPVRFPATNDREIGLQGMFQNVVPAVELTALLAFANWGAVARRREECGDACTASPELFRER